MKIFIGGFAFGQIVLWTFLAIYAVKAKKSTTTNGTAMLYFGMVFGLAAWGLF